MPLYDFQCEKCGYSEERIYNRAVLVIQCPCGEEMRRLFPKRVAFLNSAQSFQRQARANGETVGQMFAKDPAGLAELRRRAAEQGISISPDDTYHRGLAARPLDPEAVVPHDDPRGHIEKLARRRGHAVEGMVNVAARPQEPEPYTGPPIAEDIIEDLMFQEAAQDPGLASTPQKTKKLREDVINRHAPPPASDGSVDIADLL